MPRIHVTVTVAQAHRLAMLAELLDTTPAQAAALMLTRGLDSLHVWLREDGRYYATPGPLVTRQAFDGDEDER